MSILFNLLRNLFSQAFKNICTLNILELYLHWIIRDYVYMCNHKLMCYHRLQQRAVKQNHFLFLLINITLEKNPHACYLKSIFTKREQFRTEYHYLKKLIFLKEHLNMSCRKNGYTLFLLNYRMNMLIFEASSFFLIHLESCSVKTIQSLLRWTDSLCFFFPVSNNSLKKWMKYEERKS